ncbi:MAG: hypothetical protein GTO15_06395 [Pseudomonas stutzeri]|nr:hypothetical protein [Stutzerimonas stutzeri]
MAKTVQNIVDAATAQDIALDGDLFVQDTEEIIGRVNEFVNELYTQLVAYVPYYYGTKDTLTSSSGSSGRTLDLTNAGAITPFRLRKLEIDGAQLFLVEELAQGAQPSPRAFQRGTTLHEVGDEWGASGTVDVALTYTRGPAQLSESGTFSQVVDLPDRWTHPIKHRLTAYLLRKDGRPQEAPVYEQLAADALEVLVMYLKLLHGEGELE